MRAGGAKATATWARGADSRVELLALARRRASWKSSSPRGMRSGSRMTAAATTGPASGPRPASSQPATGQTPRLIAARSRRKVGRTISSSSGRRAAGFGRRHCDARCAARQLVVATHAAMSARRSRASQCAIFRRTGITGTSEQTRAAPRRARRRKCSVVSFVLAGVEAELLAGDLEAAADHPGDRARCRSCACPRSSRNPCRRACRG